MPDSIFNYTGTIAVIIALPALGVIAKIFGISFARIAKWYCYAAVFAVVVVINSIFFPFIGGKDYFFRFAVELGLIAFILWWAFEAKAGELMHLVKTAYKKPLVIAVSVFTLAVLLSAVFGYDAHAAFWSNYERGEGAFQFLHYYAFFMLLVMLFQQEEDWKNIFKFSLVAACGVILYGVMANLGYSSFISPYAGSTAPTGWWHQLIDGRFEGSLGNPAYVAPYLMFSMFFAAYLWIGSKISGALTVLKSWGYFIFIVILFFFFYLAQTRGAFLGLDASLFVFLGYLVFQERAFMRKLSSTIVLIPSILVFLIAMFVLGHGFLSSLLAGAVVMANVGILTYLICLLFSKDAFLRKWSMIILIILGIVLVLIAGLFIAVHNLETLQNIPGARSFQISASDTTAQTRFWVWGEAWKGFLDRPVFGWGQENFTAVFDKYFNPKFFVPGQNTETWFDRAHSVFFDYLVETGIVGLLSYLAIFFIFAREFFRRRKHDLAAASHHRNAAPVLRNALILAMPVAYLVQGVAIFDVLPMYVVLFLFLAFANYYFTTRTTDPNA